MTIPQERFKDHEEEIEDEGKEKRERDYDVAKRRKQHTMQIYP